MPETETLTEELVETEDTQAAEEAVVEETASEGEGDTSEVKTEKDGQDSTQPTDWEKRYKDLQAAYTKSTQDLSSLKKQAETNDSASLRAKIEGLERNISDPNYLSARMAEAQKRAEEDENLTPEQREIRALRKDQESLRASHQQERSLNNAISIYAHMRDSDPFFDKNEDRIADLLKSDERYRKAVLADPETGYAAIKGRFENEWDPAEEREKRIREKIERERLENLNKAKKAKTTISAQAGSTRAATATAAPRSVSESVDAWLAANPNQSLD